ncbi:DUF3107 domain-containing protein [Georgenia sp. Z1491]|uniref:DUF3107 domain-containing protein n=1 Tax=Georgenia sp. Z1491 TaxID=3416707 RepID=UPI003CED1EF9
MQVTIGMRSSMRDVVVEIDSDEEAFVASVREALASDSPLDVTDSKGKRFLVPAAAIGHVEIGAVEDRRVGFGLG